MWKYIEESRKYQTIIINVCKLDIIFKIPLRSENLDKIKSKVKKFKPKLTATVDPFFPIPPARITEKNGIRDHVPQIIVIMAIAFQNWKFPKI